MKIALKRLLSVSLAVLLLISVLVMPAAAAAANLSVPDSTTLRTLTIYKYATVDTLTEDTASENTDAVSAEVTESSQQDASAYDSSLTVDSAMEESAFETGEKETAAKTNTDSQMVVVGSSYKPVANVIFDIYSFAALGEDCPESIAAETAYAWIEENPGRLATSIVTDANGCAVWNMAADNSMDGIYLVVERKSSAVVSSSIVSPFLVSIPSTNITETGWDYDVIVQPKNIVLDPPSIEKDVVKLDSHQGGVNIGEKFSWIIRADIPADLYNSDKLNGKTFETFAKKYTITDELDSRLDYRGGMKVEVVENDKVILTLGDSDYALTSTAKEGVAGGKFTISLKQDGMKRIMQAVTDPDKSEIRITFDTSINKTAVPGENVYNNATLDYTNSLDYEYDPIKVTADEVPYVYTGGFKILKTDSSETTKKLSGAEFHLASSEENAKSKTWLKDADGNEIVLTTDKNGTASYRGLAYDKASTAPAGGTYYWLVETKAPDGYTLLTDPIKITVDSNSYKDTTTPVTIKNSTTTVAKDSMPLTGNGIATHWWIIALVLLGIATIAAGAAYRLRKRPDNR